ncbi:MAG: hypothetical protein GKR89_35440 [Candidatus Latescibacteria bacterium]|nr:hypothetical protein [Candidatus Latescibacterota bacterium]
MPTPLNRAQLEAYQRDGFLLVSGLTPAPVVEAAERALWTCLQLDPKDPASWPAGTPARSDANPDLLACYTPTLLAAAAQLSGDDISSFAAPQAAFSLNVFPLHAPAQWKWPSPHIDHAIKEHGHKTFPRPFRVASMFFLNDVAPHGGGTVVWPGSHRRIEALAQSDRARYEYMWVLNQELDRAKLEDPTELQPRQGDVLFYQYLCAHAGSANTTARPRLAFNAKW